MRSDLRTGTRVSAYDDVECRTILGTVVSGTERRGDLLIMWDVEEYDANSRGHVCPEDLIGTLSIVPGRVPLRHKLHLLSGGGADAR